MRTETWIADYEERRGRVHEATVVGVVLIILTMLVSIAVFSFLS